MSVEQAATAETALAAAPAKRSEVARSWACGGWPGSAFRLHHLHRPGRPNPDFTHAQRGRDVAAGECSNRAASAQHHHARGVASRAGAAQWACGCSAARPHCRPVLRHCRCSGDPRCDRRERHTRSWSRPAVSTRTRSAVENSLIVAEAYLRDHAQFVRSDIMIIAFEIARSKSVFEQEPDKLRQFLTFQAAARGLGAAIVIDKDLKVIARANVNINQTFALPPRDPSGLSAQLLITIAFALLISFQINRGPDQSGKLRCQVQMSLFTFPNPTRQCLQALPTIRVHCVLNFPSEC